MTDRARHRLGYLFLIVAAVGVLSPIGTNGCSRPDISVVSPTPADKTPPSPPTPPLALSVPQPLVLPRDDASHQARTEWWYYNGHLQDALGRSYGFELVVFQQAREGGRAGYAAHFALTDASRGRFVYAEDLRMGYLSQADEGFDLRVGEWRIQGREGADRLRATGGGYGIELELSAQKPPVLHRGDGFIAVSPAEQSYYYSRTRLAVQGILLHLSEKGEQERVPVTGSAWFDHQWGDFTLASDAGWDWFSVQLEDNTELMVSVIRGGPGQASLVYGTWVDEEGRPAHLGKQEVVVKVQGSWTSPRSGAAYPMGWMLNVPAQGLKLDLVPVLVDQELDTTASTGQVYWEGQVTVRGTRSGKPVRGMGYVELTGYAPR